MNPEMGPTQIELTGTAQNAYSGNMDPRTEAPSQPDNTARTAEQVQAGVADWERYMGIQGEEVTPEMRSTLGLFARLGVTPPDNPRGEQRAFIPPNPTGPLGTPDAAQAREGPHAQDQQADRQLREQLGRESEQLRNKNEVLKWIFDPEIREQYFNDIYALVDAKPSEFWERAFNMLTDGAKEEEFMKVVLEASRGRWTEIIAGDRYRGVNLSMEDVERGLAEANAKPGVRQRTLEEVRKELEDDFFRYILEKDVRKVLHNVNAILYFPSIKPDQLYEQMQAFQSSYGDIAFKMPGVRDMMNLYEEALYECMAENHGFLDQEAVLGTVTTETLNGKLKKNVTPGQIEIRVKERFKKMMDAGAIVIRTNDGDVDVSDMKQWEIDRTFTIARGMMIMSERLIEIAAESRLPRGKGLARYQSLFLQDVIQGISPFRHLMARFEVPEEGIAALLFDSKMGPFFKNWDPHELMRTYQQLHDHPDEFLETVDKFTFGKINPNRAGSIWSWNSWRANEDPEIRTSLQRFLLQGRRRMEDRWERAGNTGKPQLEYLDEYQNWTGTAFRFERLRGRLENLHSDNAEERHTAEEAFVKAQALFEKIAIFQPHRLYLSSMNARKRVLAGMNIDEGNISFEDKQRLRDSIENLTAIETAFLSKREGFLNEGRRFDSIVFDTDIDPLFETVISGGIEIRNEKGEIISTLTKEQRIAAARDLAGRIRADFAQNKGDYWREFVYKREYNHGFVLWTGDVPVDEYNMSALGPTGGFARRARDNDAQAKAAGMVVGIMDNLKNMDDPEQIVSKLYGVFHAIEQYDVTKARQTVVELAEGIIKFYKAGSLAKFIGPVRKTSFARLAYGSHAPAWGSQEINHFIERLKNSKLITKEKAEELERLTGGTMKHALGEGAIGLLEMMVLALITMVAETSAKEGFSGIDEISG